MLAYIVHTCTFAASQKGGSLSVYVHCGNGKGRPSRAKRQQSPAVAMCAKLGFQQGVSTPAPKCWTVLFVCTCMYMSVCVFVCMCLVCACVDKLVYLFVCVCLLSGWWLPVLPYNPSVWWPIIGQFLGYCICHLPSPKNTHLAKCIWHFPTDSNGLCYFSGCPCAYVCSAIKANSLFHFLVGLLIKPGSLFMLANA